MSCQHARHPRFCPRPTNCQQTRESSKQTQSGTIFVGKIHSWNDLCWDCWENSWSLVEIFWTSSIFRHILESQRMFSVLILYLMRCTMSFLHAYKSSCINLDSDTTMVGNARNQWSAGHQLSILQFLFQAFRFLVPIPPPYQWRINGPWTNLFETHKKRIWQTPQNSSCTRPNQHLLRVLLVPFLKVGTSEEQVNWSQTMFKRPSKKKKYIQNIA